MEKGYSTYKTANIDTADQGKLIIIAYDVAIKHCRLAIDIFSDKKKIEERTKHLFKVQDAITELMSSLKLDVGEIAQNLYKLYDYMIRKLVDANVKQEIQNVKEVLGYLESLRSAWKEAINNLRTLNVSQEETVQPGNLTVTG
ncbi:MAG: flagellar export chaperone FliS [Chitinispirillia bacterium]|jgi:flagellar protein FliS